MVDYRTILRLSSQGNTGRQIAASVGSSRNTVSDVLEVAEGMGISWPLDESVTNAELQNIMFPRKANTESNYLEPDYEYIHRELAKPGVKLTLLWDEYRVKCENCGKNPYMSTQFGDKYRKWARITKATMRIHHKPGDVMEVDWAGNTLPIYDSVTGEVSAAYLFVAVLPCSCYTYAELCRDMKQESWLTCHAHAYNYFGGTTRLLVPDNLKTGVISNTRYETVLNRSYHELAEFYDTAIVPCRVEAPRDKSHAEGGVKFSSTWILAAIRNEHFFSFEEASEAVKIKLEELNRRDFKDKNRNGNRLSSFLEEEKTYMKPLPVHPYEVATWIPGIKVGYDYLVTDGTNKYSVPFDLIGERVDIRITRNAVEVFFKSNRVAIHVRNTVAQKAPIVNPEHMTPEHRKYLNYNTNDFMAWANSVGVKTAQVVKCFLNGGKEAEQGFKSCASLAKLADKYGNEKLEDSCSKVLSHTTAPSMRIITTVIKSKQNKPEGKGNIQTDYSNNYGITRGVGYYGKGGASK